MPYLFPKPPSINLQHIKQAMFTFSDCDTTNEIDRYYLTLYYIKGTNKATYLRPIFISKFKLNPYLAWSLDTWFENIDKFIKQSRISNYNCIPDFEFPWCTFESQSYTNFFTFILFSLDRLAQIEICDLEKVLHNIIRPILLMGLSTFTLEDDSIYIKNVFDLTLQLLFRPHASSHNHTVASLYETIKSQDFKPYRHYFATWLDEQQEQVSPLPPYVVDHFSKFIQRAIYNFGSTKSPLQPVPFVQYETLMSPYYDSINSEQTAQYLIQLYEHVKHAHVLVIQHTTLNLRRRFNSNLYFREIDVNTESIDDTDLIFILVTKNTNKPCLFKLNETKHISILNNTASTVWGSKTFNMLWSSPSFCVVQDLSWQDNFLLLDIFLNNFLYPQNLAMQRIIEFPSYMESNNTFEKDYFSVHSEQVILYFLLWHIATNPNSVLQTMGSLNGVYIFSLCKILNSLPDIKSHIDFIWGNCANLRAILRIRANNFPLNFGKFQENISTQKQNILNISYRERLQRTPTYIYDLVCGKYFF